MSIPLYIGRLVLHVVEFEEICRSERPRDTHIERVECVDRKPTGQKRRQTRSRYLQAVGSALKYSSFMILLLFHIASQAASKFWFLVVSLISWFAPNDA